MAHTVLSVEKVIKVIKVKCIGQLRTKLQLAITSENCIQKTEIYQKIYGKTTLFRLCTVQHIL
jgi:hypothetical protein